MSKACVPPEEVARLKVVASLSLKSHKCDLTDIVALASDLCRAPIAFVAIVEARAQIFYATSGLDATSIPRGQSFCDYVIAQKDVFWVEDAHEDVRFVDNPLVAGDSNLRFHAGAPIFVDGHCVGAICVVDRARRFYDPNLVRGLVHLATGAAKRVEAHREIQQLRALEARNPDAIVTLDGEGIVRGWNPAAKRLFGHAPGDIIGQSVSQILPAAERDHMLAKLTSLVKGPPAAVRGKSEPVKGLCATGEEVSLDASYSLHRLGVHFRLSAVLRDCTEREARQAELARALTAAQAGAQAKAAFLANMSHELRTPLNAITGLALAIEQNPTKANARRLAEIIRRAGFGLGQLLDDVLLASRGDDLVNSRPAPIDLLALGGAVVDLYTPAATNKGIVVKFLKRGPCATQVLGDEVRLRRVLNNLLSNAVKFTERGEISLTLSPREGGGVLFEVRDTGIGFSEAFAERLFERFSQEEMSAARRFSGAGLGLATSRDLARAMGGDLTGEGKMGKGAVFRLDLPLPAVEPERILSETRAEHSAPERDLSALRVLIVDDNAINRQVLEIMLASLGAHATSAEDGRQGLDLALKARYDVILMDLHMPILDGLETTRRLRDHEAANYLTPTPVIMVSADNSPEAVRTCKAAGAQAYLGKPVSPSVLFPTLAAVLREDDVETLSREHQARRVVKIGGGARSGARDVRTSRRVNRA